MNAPDRSQANDPSPDQAAHAAGSADDPEAAEPTAAELDAAKQLLGAPRTATGDSDEPVEGTVGRAPPGQLDAKKRKAIKPTFLRLMRYLEPHKPVVVVVGALVIVSAALVMVGPWLTGLAIDDAIANADRTSLGRIALILVATFLGFSITMAAYTRLMAKVAQQVMHKLREDLFTNLQTQSLQFFDRRPVGEIMSRLTNDVDAVEQLLAVNVVNILQSLVTVVGIIVFMLFLDVPLTLAALAPLPLLMRAAKWIGETAGPLFGDYQRGLGRLTGVVEEQITGQQVIIAFDHHEAAEAEFEVANEHVRAAGIKAQSRTLLMFPLTFGFGNVSTIFIVGVGGWMAAGGSSSVTVGLIAAFIAYSQRLGRPISQLGQSATAIISAVAGAERIFTMMDEQPTVEDRQDATPMPPIDGHVVFEDVTFAYDEGVPVLHEVALEARPGEVIGVVGPTGAGKTTIINMLARFYDIASGTVTIDGVDIRDVTQDSLRDQIGVVLQDTFLFTGTVRENIRFGREDATDEEVEAAAVMANADAFIRHLPHGYDTVLSEGASNLSLGQRQVLAIARCILSDPRILILDEATSSVDTRTEIVIQQAMLRLMEGRTSFVIAHRLSTVRHADQILVVDGGRIAERGTHEELLEQGGTYAGLYHAQFRDRDLEAALAG